MTGNDIKMTRIGMRVLQYRLAAALGIPQATLSRIENERVYITERQVCEIVDAIYAIADPRIGPIERREMAVAS